MASRYTPNSKEKHSLETALKLLKRTINTKICKNLELRDVGSTAKGTWLLGESDIDMYIYTYALDEVFFMVKHLYPGGHEKKGRLKIWNFPFRGFDVDLIIANPHDWKREDTSKHTEYFNEHLTDQMKNEVRDAKALFKTYGVYGAETGGIVGVAIEELIVRLKSMKNLCFILSTGPKPYIQDPTMTTPRDLLACITPRRWLQLQKVCQGYLQMGWFTYQPMTMGSFVAPYRREGYKVEYYNRSNEDRAIDFQGAQASVDRALRILKQEIPEAQGDADVYADKEQIAVVYNVSPKELPSHYERCIALKRQDTDSEKVAEDIEAFTKKHPDAFLKQGQICAKIERGARQWPETFFFDTVDLEMKRRGYTRSIA